MRAFSVSFEEGVQLLNEMRNIGQRNIAAQAAITAGLARVSGAPIREMLQVGMTGAGMFRGTGISMSIGSRFAQDFFALSRIGLAIGNLTPEQLQQVGGPRGFAVTMTQAMGRMMQTQYNRALLLASMQAGPQGIMLNRQRLNQLIQTGTYPQILQAAVGRISKPIDLITFHTNMANLQSQAGAESVYKATIAQVSNIMNVLRQPLGVQTRAEERALGIYAVSRALRLSVPQATVAWETMFSPRAQAERMRAIQEEARRQQEDRRIRELEAKNGRSL
mgnify:CR=1 FL=1